jgi:hypothetical protein
MTSRLSFSAAIATLGIVAGCRAVPDSSMPTAAIDRDLMDVTVPELERLYADRKYTVTRVVKWHLDRIDRYNGVYGAIETVMRDEALAAAALEDTQSGGTRGPL